MGRLLGLGFIFGAKDKGAVKVTEEIGGSFDDMSESVRQVGKETTGLLRFGNAINALNFLQISRVKDAMQGLAEKAGLGDKAQADQIESWGVQFGKTYRMATAGLGDFRKEVDKYKGAISGVSFTLEVDAAEMTKAIGLIVRSGYKLEDYGLTVRDVAGLTQAGILSGEQLSDVLTSLAQGYELGARGAGKLLDEVAAIGEVAGAGADAIQSIPEAIKTADAAIAGLPEGMAGNVDDMVKSLTILAASTQRVLGGPYQDAFQAATEVMGLLTDSRKELAKTFTGLGGEFPELGARLAESYGSIDKAFEVMSADPALFIQEIQKVYASLDEVRRFRLLEQLPESIKFMVKAGAQGAKTIEKMRKPIEDTTGALGKMARASSGAARTFTERMDLIGERYEAALRRMMKAGKKDAEVVDMQRKAYRRLEKVLENQVKKGGLGERMVKTWLYVRRYGFLRGIFLTLKEAADKDGPFGKFAASLNKYKPYIEGFGEAVAEIAPAVVAVGAALYYFQKGPMKGLFVALGNFGKRLLLFMPWMAALAAVGYLIYKNWDMIAPVLKELGRFLKGELGPTFEVVEGLGNDLWESIKIGVGIIWDDYLEPFGKWFQKELPAMIGAGAYLIGATFVGIRLVVKGAVTAVIALLHILGRSAIAVGVALKEGIGGAVAWVVDKFEGFFSYLHVGWKKLARGFKTGIAGVLEIISFFLDKIPKTMLEKVGLGGFVDTWKKGAKTVMTDLREDISTLDRDIYNLEEARRRSNAEADREGMDRLRKIEEASNQLNAAYKTAGDSFKAVGREGVVGMENVRTMAERATRAAVRARKARGKVVPKKAARRRGRKAVEAERQEAAAVAKEAEVFMVRGSTVGPGGAAEPLENFLKKPAVGEVIAAGVQAGMEKRDKRRPRVGRGSAPGGAEVEG
jgi:hypothetical protein